MWHRFLAEHQQVGDLLVWFLAVILIDQVQINLIKAYLLSSPLLDPPSTETYVELSFGLVGFALSPQMCGIYPHISGVADHPWYREWSHWVGCRSLEAFQTVLSCSGKWEFPARSVLASVCVFGIPTTIVHAYLAAQGILVQSCSVE